MKLAILSDIHGNLPALEAVVEDIDAWGADIVIVNGDVVNRGPLSRACWDLVKARCEQEQWRLISGNHEAFVALWAEMEPDQEDIRFEIDRASYWTYEQLNGEAAELLELSTLVSFPGPDGGEVRCTHASMGDNRSGIYSDTPAELLRQQIAPPPAVFCTAHTHAPLVRTLDRTLVVNSGAAGTTFDGDWRASYAQLTWQKRQWQAEIIRVDYDRQRAAANFRTSGFLSEGGALVEIFFQEWYQARPMVGRWAHHYEEAVVAGELDLEESVHRFLAKHGVETPYAKTTG